MWVFEFVYVSLGLLLLDGILWAVVGFSASPVSRATGYVVWKVSCEYLFGFRAGHVSWGRLSDIWIVFCSLCYFVYLFIVLWISSCGFLYTTCISYLFHMNFILYLSNGLWITTSGL